MEWDGMEWRRRFGLWFVCTSGWSGLNGVYVSCLFFPFVFFQLTSLCCVRSIYIAMLCSLLSSTCLYPPPSFSPTVFSWGFGSGFNCIQFWSSSFWRFHEFIAAAFLCAYDYLFLVPLLAYLCIALGACHSHSLQVICYGGGCGSQVEVEA